VWNRIGLKGSSGGVRLLNVDGELNKNKNKRRGVGYGSFTDILRHHASPAQKSQNLGPKKGSEISVFGSPGRGVLRFWGGGIQESRSYFGQKRPKNQKIDRFRG